LAITGRSFSDCSANDTARGVIRRKSGVPRAGGHTGNVGLSPTRHSGSGDRPRSGAAESDEFEISLLAQLLQLPAEKDASRISRRIIARYGHVASILTNPEHEAFFDPALPGSVRRKLRLVGTVIGNAFRHELLSKPVFSHSETVRQYLRLEMSGLAREQLRVLYLDAANQLLEDRVMWEGSVNSVQIHPREIVRVALETGATALILVHNHPSGRCTASEEDIGITKRVIAACQSMDIAVHDHLIIGRTEIFSMRQAKGAGSGLFNGQTVDPEKKMNVTNNE
jgi:DNA repair protein RadC